MPFDILFFMELKNYIFLTINKNEKIFRSIFFGALLLVGYISFQDYGVSLDEDAYKTLSYIDYNFIKEVVLNLFTIDFKESFKNYIQLSAKSSSFFYVFLYFLKDILKFDLNAFAHIFLNFFFILSLYFFFLIIKDRFKSNFFSYLSVLIIFSSPRIFAKSFYNPRDLFYLCLIIINIYFVKKLFTNLNYKNIILYSIITGICLHVRIFTLFFLFSTLIFLICEYEGKLKNKIIFKKIIAILILSFLSLILITPYLWINTFSNFFNFYLLDLKITSTVKVTNQFFGELYSSQNSPWYYYLIWFFFTTPLIYVFYLLTGYIYSAKEIIYRFKYLTFNSKPWGNKNELFDTYVFINILVISFILFRFSNVHFDGWRHLYFLYPLLVFYIIIFLNFLYLNKKIIYKFFSLLLLLNIFYNFNWIINNHPYQYVYFNYLNSLFKDKSFDLDYWSLSNYDIYKYLLKNFNYPQISIGTVSHNDLIDNYNILSENDRKRLVIKHPDTFPDFLIDNYRIPYKKEKIFILRKILKNYVKIFEISVDENIISTLYQRK